MLQAVKIPYFKDLFDLDPGDQWWPQLKQAIDECDLFLLFWSADAKRSEWVRKEVVHALQRQAGNELSPPEIRPVILEGPPIIEPWAELSHVHFNDKLLYFMSPKSQMERWQEAKTRKASAPGLLCAPHRAVANAKRRGWVG